MKESRKREIRSKADTFREKCKVNRYGILDLFKECEQQGYKLLRYPLGEDADLGFVMNKDEDIVIVTNTSNRLAREIFTLAHEIGHIALHMKNADSFVDDAITISTRSADEKEQEANYFAACLLMPEEEVDKFLDLEILDFRRQGLSAMDIARIMSEFNVSFETALNRLESLGKIDSNARIKLDDQRNQRRVSNLLKSVGGNRHLNEANQEIEIPHEYLEYVIFNYNRCAIPEETLKRVLTYYQLSMDDINDRLKQEDKDEDDDFEELIGGLTE